MEIKLSISPETFRDFKSPDDKLNTLYDTQVVVVTAINELGKDVRHRKVFDRVSVFIGGVCGGVLGALGFKIGH